MYHKLRKLIDRIIAILLIFFVPVLAVYFVDCAKIMNDSYDGVKVSGTMLGVWGAMLGFMITAMSILMTLGDGEFIEIIRGSSHFKTIMFILSLTCMILFAATAFGAFVVCFNYWSDFCLKMLLYFLFSTGIAILISMVFIFYLVLGSTENND